MGFIIPTFGRLNLVNLSSREPGCEKYPGQAVNNVQGWWSVDIKERADKLGAEFVSDFGDIHHSTQKITELVPGKKVVWWVQTSRLNFIKEKNELDGPDIIFEITPKNGKTELRFTHAGVVPVIECYGDCSVAWNFYIKHSLFDLITKGQGEPSRNEKAEVQPVER